MRGIVTSYVPCNCLDAVCVSRVRARKGSCKTLLEKYHTARWQSAKRNAAE